MKSVIRRARGAFVLSAFATVLLAGTPAHATFHIAHIERILTGLNGSSTVQFVQIEMDAAGQTQTNGAKLIAFDNKGNFDHVVLVLNKNITNGGAGKSFLMASAGFEAATGMAPDFVFPTAEGNALPTEAGMVCWGKPTDQTDPDSTNMVDCVSYGNYTGPANVHTSAPSPVTPFGHGLGRIAKTGSSANDFACEDPTTPITNAPDKRGIDATSSCEVLQECGNGTVEDPEQCDDGDTSFTPGDYCSADCEAFSCGIPTNLVSATPKTSDALFVLRSAVGSTTCDLAVCDVNDSASISTTDALLVLKKAVGQSVILDCPAQL